MKRILAISLAALYLSVTIGLVFSVHYCMGEPAGVALGHRSEERCGKCGMEDADCCKDHVVIVKVQDAHSHSGIAYAPKPFPTAAHPEHHFLLETPAGLCGRQASPVAHAPPGEGSVPLHLLHRVFRI